MRNTRAIVPLFELSAPGRRGTTLPPSDVPYAPMDEILPAAARAHARSELPEVAEPDVVRHFTCLSQLNMSVDTHFYPLGSCTMKYNPKRNERLASLPGLLDLHPYQSESSHQGMLQLLFELQQMLAEIAGLDAVSLQPAAGAHGEMTALMTAAAYFRDHGRKRRKVLAPDSAHGTNPASAAVAGFDAVTVRSGPDGYVDLDDLRAKLDDQTAVFMITNPNTLGMFEKNIRQIADMVHGGAIAALADVTVMAAAWAQAEVPDSLRGVTVSMTISYLAPARATDLIGLGRVLRQGRSLVNCDVDIVTPDGEAVAKAIATYKVG